MRPDGHRTYGERDQNEEHKGASQEMSQGPTSLADELPSKSVRQGPRLAQVGQAPGLFAGGRDPRAEWWRRARLDRRMTTAEVAHVLKVSQRYVQSIEAGSRLPSARLMVEATVLFATKPSAWLRQHVDAETRCHPLLDLAERLIDAGWHEEAAIVLTRVIFLGRQFYRGRYTGELCRLAGILRFRQSRARQACLWFSRMERAYGRQGSTRRRLQGHFNHALALAGIGRYRAALERLDRAERLSRGLSRERATIHYARGHLLTQIRSYQEAETEYRKAGHLLGWQDLGFESRFGEVVAVWGSLGAEAALPLAKGIVSRALPGAQRERACHNLAVLYRQIGDAAMGRQLLEQALTEHHGDGKTAEASTLAELLLCQVTLGDESTARETLIRFRTVADAAAGIDLASVQAICVALGWTAPVGRPIDLLHDGYERRLAAALTWATARASSNSSFREFKERQKLDET